MAVGASPIEGLGLFAKADFVPSANLIRLAGQLVTTQELEQWIRRADADPGAPFVDSLTIHEGEHLVLPPGSIVHFGNHSCDPNMWHNGAFTIISRRPIFAGEEMTIDYGTQSGAPGFSMVCSCGTPHCRRMITSDDWRIPKLQAVYEGHWVPALSDRISRA
jgi:SET domain-containing protein